MATVLKTIKISEQVGRDADSGPIVRDLIRAIKRAVAPDEWLHMGGKASVEAVFNKKDWFLVVSAEDAAVKQIEDDILAKMKLPA